MYTITKQFEFVAGHHLEGLPEGHKCGRDHGHNYIVEVELQSEELNDVGFVQDYGELDGVKELVARLDHHNLNPQLFEVIEKRNKFGPRTYGRNPINPTAENLAKWFYDHLIEDYPLLTAVRISETPKTWAEYRPAKVPAEHAATWVQSSDEMTLTVDTTPITVTFEAGSIVITAPNDGDPAATVDRLMNRLESLLKQGGGML